MPFRRAGTFTLKTADQLEKERTALLREQDTDTDGLHDYDELYVFKTSPFLEDSDSDGVNDGAEVAAESDPNCPKGKTCRQPKLFSGSQTASTSLGTGTTGTTQPAAGTGTTPTATAEQEQRILAAITETFGDINNLTPEVIADGMEKMSSTELRTFLAKLGIPQVALDKADDATLRALLKETLDELAVQPSGGTQQ